MFPDGGKDDIEGSYFSRPIQGPRNNQWKTRKPNHADSTHQNPTKSWPDPAGLTDPWTTLTYCSVAYMSYEIHNYFQHDITNEY